MNDKNSPFQAEVLEYKILTAPQAVRTTYHIALDLTKNPHEYKSGDALGVIPHNDPLLVDNFYRIFNCDKGDEVLLKSNQKYTIKDALTQHVDLQKIPLALWKLLQEKCVDVEERRKLEKFQVDKPLKQTMCQDVLDVLCMFPKTPISVIELFPLLATLKPRLYSISSAVAKYPTEVHIVIAAVETTHDNRVRKGVSSSITCWNLQKGDNLNIYFVPNHHFRLPANQQTPIIMVGPGTGVAPFRSFMQERVSQNSKKNWLFFGMTSKEHSFLYREEFESWEKQHVLKLTTVFSKQKVFPYYVQHSIEQNAEEVWNWIHHQKAHFYICGDAQYMAKDVQISLINLVMKYGFMDHQQSQKYLKEMKKEKRLLLDIY